MAYPNYVPGYPGNMSYYNSPQYMPQMQQPIQQPIQQPQQLQDDRIWVSSKAAAEAYFVAPGALATLWNTNGKEFYQKRVDATGRPLPLVTCYYSTENEEVAPIQTEVPKLDYATKNELNDLKSQFEELSNQFSALYQMQSKPQNKNNNSVKGEKQDGKQ